VTGATGPGNRPDDVLQDRSPLQATIALTRYQEPNWLLWETLDAVAAQQGLTGEVLVLDQAGDEATAARVASIARPGWSFQWYPIAARSLSYARNRAIEMSRFPLVLFLDSDALADPRWASELAATLAKAGVGVAGGRIMPKWHRRPLFITKSRFAREQYSLLDYGPGEAAVAKVVGAGFGIHRERLGQDARFDERLGRRAGLLLGGEETDLCARAARAGVGVRYNGRAVVYHQVLPERIRYSWLLKRIFYAGVSRALRGGAPSSTHRLTLWDLVFMPVILPVYIVGYLRGRAWHDVGAMSPPA
jgi:GT2 family glycosyltransferase